MDEQNLRNVHIHVRGIVQGVGFRPFVFNLAEKNQLTGWVKNTSAGVEIEISGTGKDVENFIYALQHDAPPLASLDEVRISEEIAPPSGGKVSGWKHFEIIHSEALPQAFQPISPDVAICPDCLHELFSPSDPRYRYPFINCTNCGPRFSIITDIPYDRPNTSMAAFEMCPRCRKEYEDPRNRRFHAQPIACPDCGPQIWLEDASGKILQEAESSYKIPIWGGVIPRARKMLMEGKILAVKGLGGFHLACDAHNAQAVELLRQRKLRVHKPFAVMAADRGSIEKYCHVSDAEWKLLSSPAHPIVLLKKRSNFSLPASLTPGQFSLGVMLAYTPLHALLLEEADGFTDLLVMTSGNLSEEPICTDNEDARAKLSGLADAFLMHNRDIYIRTDDSVTRQMVSQIVPVRRARGYAPLPVRLPFSAQPVFAAGAELKNTFCLTREDYAFTSHHIGDLENYETLKSYESGIDHFERIFRVKPVVLAHDLHPDYLSTRYALERAAKLGLPALAVQHHHAHIASLMAEQGLDGSNRVIGVAFDGTGYGTDGAIWGGEFLLADYAGFERVGNLKYFPLPGGEASIKKPARIALALLQQAGLEWDYQIPAVKEFTTQELNLLARQLEKNINSPRSSSMGRLFDAVSALAGVCQRVTYEGQAAIELETICDPETKSAYRFESIGNQIDFALALKEITADVLAGVPAGVISAKFHNGIAEMTASLCEMLRVKSGINQIALSGGVWQNGTLLEKTRSRLLDGGFEVFFHRVVPTNDGGISLGQAAIAAYKTKS